MCGSWRLRENMAIHCGLQLLALISLAPKPHGKNVTTNLAYAEVALDTCSSAHCLAKFSTSFPHFSSSTTLKATSLRSAKGKPLPLKQNSSFLLRKDCDAN